MMGPTTTGCPYSEKDQNWISKIEWDFSTEWGLQRGFLQLLRALYYENDEVPKQHLVFKRHQTKNFLVTHAFSEH